MPSGRGAPRNAAARWRSCLSSGECHASFCRCRPVPRRRRPRPCRGAAAAGRALRAGHDEGRGGRHQSFAAHLPDQADHPGAGRPADPAVSALGAGRPFAAQRPGRHRRPDLQGQRPEAGLEARYRRSRRVPPGGAGRRGRDHRRVRPAHRHRSRPGPGGDDAEHAQHPVHLDLAVPGRPLHAPDHGRPARDLSGRLDRVHRPARGRPQRRHRRLRERPLRHLRRLAGVRRPPREKHRPDPRRQGTSEAGRGCRCAEVPGSQAGTGGHPQEDGRAGAEAVRRAALRPLPVPVLAVRADGRQRPGAPAQQRERRRHRLLHRLEGEAGLHRPAGARVRAFLERQVPPRRGPVGAQPQHAHAEQPAVGVRGPDPVLGQRAGRAQRHAPAAGLYRRAGAGRRRLCRQPAGPVVARHPGHHQ